MKCNQSRIWTRVAVSNSCDDNHYTTGTSTLLAITAFLSRSPGLLNRGPGGPASLGHVPQSSIFSPTATAQSGAWGATLLGAGFLYRILSPNHLISNWLNFLCTELYNSSTPTFFLWASQIALIQPVHGQGYILVFLDRMHLLFTQVHFLFWQLGRVGGQYTTETTNHIISECSKFVQKDYKTRHDWVGKVIDWELCKEFKFDPTNQR